MLRRVGKFASVAVALTAGFAVLCQRCGPSEPPWTDAGIDTVRDAPPAEGDTDADACVHPLVTSNCRDGWCEIPAGCYKMGSPPEEWGRGLNNEDIIEVTLTHPFIIQEFELTQSQWTSLGYANRSGLEDGGNSADCLSPLCPASRMTWFEAVQFTNTLSQVDGRQSCYEMINCNTSGADNILLCDEVRPTVATVYDCEGYRLPTEAEWEYAARAGTTTAFYSGGITSFAVQGDCNYDPNLDNIGWYCWNSGADGGGWLPTHPVGLKQRNDWGLYDMSGNACEFVGDPYHGRYTRPTTNPWQALSPTETDVSRRGGCAYLWASVARSADRLAYGRKWHDFAHGFRVVRTIKTNENWTAPPLPIPYGDAGSEAGE